jgi:succinyl-diaminopimelate desuccinylase
MSASSDLIALTRKLISFNTINPPGQERECAHYIAKLLQDGGFKVKLFEFEDTRTSLVARSGDEGELPICFTGHIDTVPLGESPWHADPFKGETDGDKIYGRGSADMKGGVAAMIIAAVSFLKTAKNNAPITLVITAGEETGSQGAKHLAGLNNALGQAGALVVAEPTSNYPLVAHKGALWLEAQTKGITAHGSMPDQGVNAIYKAVDVLRKLMKIEFTTSAHPLLGKPTLNVGTISGGLNINSVPDRTTIGVDIRTIPSQTNENIFSWLKSCLGEDVLLKKIVDVGSVATDPELEWVQDVFDITGAYLGERPEPRGVNYFTDASVLTPAYENVPTVILGPGEAQMAHKTDEYCCISKIEHSFGIYTDLLSKWCSL